ncbi:MAG: GNAT family N-acetyltransferase [Firmicutes bacterium]|nr:GNAT family N-acetyltransferase [Bacillota bacterium]
MLETERLLLRPWREDDAAELYRYACDPQVGPVAGWPVHTDAENSRQIIRDVLSLPETYALVLKATGLPVGCIALKFPPHTDLTAAEDEAELGFWVGRPYWGRGLMPEAVRALLRRAFLELDLRQVWCAYYDGNEKSRRVQEKCGFRYCWTSEQVEVPLLHETRRGHVNCLTRAEWLAAQTTPAERG